MGPLERIKRLKQNTYTSVAICPSCPLLEEENKDATSIAMPEGFLQAENDLQVKPPLSMTCLATSRVFYLAAGSQAPTRDSMLVVTATLKKTIMAQIHLDGTTTHI